MATRPKDAPTTSTHKKAASTKAAAPTTTALSSQAKTRPSSSGEKQVPNYLKPTISSRHDAPANPKPALNRRKSFDSKTATAASRAVVKPASPDRGPALAKSASTKSRGTSSKLSKPLYAKSARKGSGESFVKKEGSSATAAEEQPRLEGNVDHDDHEDRVVEVAPEQDHGDNGEAKTEVSDISIVSEELVVKPEGEDGREEKPEEHHSESQETRDKDEEITIEKEEKEEGEEVEEKVVEEGDNGERGVAVKELEEENGEEAEVKEENGEGKEEAKKREGKKEAQMAYNEVIEETTSKLLEKRKNKVKALVGAFETVIDYESAAKQRESD